MNFNIAKLEAAGIKVGDVVPNPVGGYPMLLLVVNGDLINVRIAKEYAGGNEIGALRNDSLVDWVTEYPCKPLFNLSQLEDWIGHD